MSFEYVQQYFKDNNCELLEKEYKNNNTLMQYQCNCGNISEISFHNFYKGTRCKKCGTIKIIEQKRHSFEYIQQYFKDQECELLENIYINNHINMKYKCSCEDISYITFANFQQGCRCKKCGIKKNKGPNNHKYNPALTDKDRIDRRLIPGYKQWMKQIYKKNNYICQHCHKQKNNNGKYKQLNAHHIEGYAENSKLRLDINNGITLCQECHMAFHSIYGTINIHKQQLDEYLSITV